ncbi:hypothetical protein SCAB_64701 [Streptomyces scabiei 87.22]|uniref:Uncharacterized protein n=1 Tax=Streptomyces scabiei (strain 87.22) TaxID=680198 RepID=C9ZE41_STRSW|nr:MULTISPECIES: hypothetical protein [Streptomyces]MBP5931887.1 hypothetical protein [Streptomyces sp. LBUM 1479]MDX2551355.1 hypothetical protein [Streptomyces stelliscabiei]MDX3052933.1 hypothetical protein [Streptomyces scabiei]MDX3078726.1 hypothetical protein [Streptomyces scabiei]MDX3177548.1 hypothetical protein [Streptomyces scabiei]
MTYNLAPKGAPWFEHLTDSVRALGEAAREWQLADRAASLNEAHVGMERSVLHEGRTTHEPGPDTVPLHRRTYDNRRPHVSACYELQRLYREHRSRTRRGYRDTAMLYASGAAWAITQAQTGREPHQVVFTLDHYERPAPIPHGYGIECLGPYAGAKELAAAYEQLRSMHLAEDISEEIAGRPDHEVTERDASDMWEAGDYARGLPDAAYAYGRLLERALQYTLLGPKNAHRRQLAEQRAAEQAAAADEAEGGSR